MSYVPYNPNPLGKTVGDCVIRAISKIMKYDWDKTYVEVSLQGFEAKDILTSNPVWGAYLRKNGFKRYVIPNTCPDCYAVRDFCLDHPVGEFILATGSHVIAVVDGNYYDSWDSGNETPVYFWTREINERGDLYDVR